MDYNDDYFDMFSQLEQENSTQCVVYDKTPGSNQKKINIIVRPVHTVGKVINDISTQFPYKSFDLVLETVCDRDMVYLNRCQHNLIYQMPGFEPLQKNTLLLFPPGEWERMTDAMIDAGTLSNKLFMTTSIQHSAANSNNNNNSSSSNNSNNNNDNTLHNSNNNFNMSSGSAVCAIGSGSPSPQSTMTTITNTNTATDSLNLSPMSDPDLLSDDDLALGASASPTETEPMNGGGALALAQTSPTGSRTKYGPMTEEDLYQQVCAKMPLDRYYDPTLDKKYVQSSISVSSTSTGNGYVGLVNQAMTCYLNSLLQALYMTPEFRNALYRWEFDNDNEAKNIPYQLQKLFLNLQTSKKSAVETTDLTRSFGWDSTEAWQQHDIQELCRVMFDALEHKFKNTKQMNLIANLYEGKMLDYVKCLECNREKSRADKFLDIPLPVRPFGSTVAYGSIEEALRAFVQPEILDGNNQYFCEKCNKKCDAHKGLKFMNFPYVLTLHLKRFDFDYQTMHRIKLNDKVTFPQTLNLNSFVNATDVQENGAPGASNGFAATSVIGATNTDDCSTTDSGSAMEEDNCSSGIATTASSSQHENDMNDDDEGIDMSTSTDHRVRTSVNAEQRLKHESGPYLYELFAIMIHSGSASGGHYYAYIKEFENGEWFCFNDQSVTPITQEDIQKSFGGGSNKAYYSSLYSSSTNAYMLMYRQIDPKRNEPTMKVSDFPEHINKMLPKLHMEEEQRVSRTGRHSSVSDLALPELVKARVYFYHPLQKKMKVTRVYVSRSFDVKSVLESAYQLLNVEQFAPISQCRIVGYDQSYERILQSFENITDPSLTELRASCDGTLDFLLEVHAEGNFFEVYEPGGTTWSVYMLNLTTKEIDGPYLVYSVAHESNAVLRRSIAIRLNLKDIDFLLAALSNNKAFVAYEPNPTKEMSEQFEAMAKAQLKNVTYFYLNVPCTDANSLEVMGIPSNDLQTPAIEISTDVVDAVLMNSNVGVGETTTHTQNLSVNDCARRESPLLSGTATGQESNSEDSSLSDGDRTLVETMQNRGGGDSQISSTNHSPQLSSPEDELLHDSYTQFDTYNSDVHDESEASVAKRNAARFFHAIPIESLESVNPEDRLRSTNNDMDDVCSRKPGQSYKLIVNSHMKMGAFKRHIESLIHVPTNYFKIQRKHDSIDSVFRLMLLNEGETLSIELGKILQPDENKAKIYFMRLSDLNNDTGKLPCICQWIYQTSMTVGKAKKDLVAKLHRIDSKYQTLTADNCRIWLKGGRNPVKILSDDELLANDMRTTTVAIELLIQECENGAKPQPSEDSLTIFVRRWHPDTLQLDKFEEITLEKDGELRSTLAKLSNIPEPNIVYSKITNSSFPCTNISLLNLNSSMGWLSVPATMDKYPLTTTLTGNVYFYKDATTAAKELTTEERRELNAKEKIRLDRLSCSTTSLYSPRRERALKIYLDSPQTTKSALVATSMDESSTNGGSGSGSIKNDD